MTNGKLIEKTAGGKLRATAKLAGEVAKLRNSGESLPKTIAKLDAKTGEKTIHLVSPLYWKLAAMELGPLDPKPATVLAARRSGERREIVALRANLSLADVAKMESKSKKPVYTGRGTRKHLAVA
jgi:hypothetical protein